MTFTTVEAAERCKKYFLWKGLCAKTEETIMNSILKTATESEDVCWENESTTNGEVAFRMTVSILTTLIFVCLSTAVLTGLRGTFATVKSGLTASNYYCLLYETTFKNNIDGLFKIALAEAE